MSRYTFLHLIFLLSIIAPSQVVAAESAPGIEMYAAGFRAADTDGDKRLSLEEFVANRSPISVARRDFLLFDLNQNNFLEIDEFAAVPDAVPGLDRGPMPDPLTETLDRMVDSIDKSLGNWHERPNERVDSARFEKSISAMFATARIQFDSDSLDSNNDGKLERAEVRRFLENQLGIRRGDGTLLRKQDGRIANYSQFLYIDENRNDSLERDEFLDRSGALGNPGEEFANADLNQDGSLSFNEWQLVPGRGVLDPVIDFRRMDTNLDAYLDRGELLAGTDDWRRRLVANVFPGFDVNRDDKLSLAEYRMTLHANVVLPWDWTLPDTNRSNFLSFEEFHYREFAFPEFDRFQFPMLRYLCFNRLDINSNGELDETEFFFRRRDNDAFFVMNEDGSDWKLLFRYEGHAACGSVAVSPDGKSIAFDARSDLDPKSPTIHVADIDGNNPRQICTGMMPTWSRDGQFLACSRFEPTYGAWMIEVNGEGNGEHLSNGWGAQWSPDGRRISFFEGRSINSLNIEKDEIETILDSSDNPFQQIYENMGWSPDCRRICFKGNEDDKTSGLATANTVGSTPEIKVHFTTKAALNADNAWHPKGDRIVFAMYCVERGALQLYEFNPNNTDRPKLVKGQDATRNNNDVSWSPDGKRLYIVSGDN